MKRSPLPPRKTPLKRAPLPRSSAPLPRPTKPIAQMSARRLSQRERRSEVVAEVTTRDRVCQAGAVHALVPGVCCGGPLDVHERIPRSAWPNGFLEPSNCLLVCRNAHGWIDGHPHGAHALGLHGWSWEAPEPVRVYLRDREGRYA